MSEKKIGLSEIKYFPDKSPDKVKPTSITLDLTHRCPFKCSGCIESQAMKHSSKTSLHKKTVCRLISQFAATGGKEILFYGGEPTMHPEFSSIILHAAKDIPLIRVVTNGAFLAKPKVSESLFRAAEMTEVIIRVSLNAGTSKTHERLHHANGFFNQIIDGMQVLKGSGVKVSVSFMVEDKNANEITKAFRIAEEVGAKDFWIRPKTGLHGIGLVPMRATNRNLVLNSSYQIEQSRSDFTPSYHIERWFLEFLKYNIPPNTTKSYTSCYYCSASRLIITPPDPGIVWSCTYWRGDPLFYVTDLKKTPFGSDEFESRRQKSIRRVNPRKDCIGVICNRDEANKAIWRRYQAKKRISIEKPITKRIAKFITI